jgi:hypothetical protein
MTDPNPDLPPDAIEQANVAAAAIAGFTLAQFAFGELIKNGILPKGHAEQLLRKAIETHGDCRTWKSRRDRTTGSRSAKSFRN